MSTVLLHFPSEVLYAIFSHLHDDKPLLASCSLVARSWCQPSRAHLFQSIALTAPQLHEFEDTMNAAPVLGRAVRYLQVCGVSNALITPLDTPRLHSLLHKLPGLLSLLLAGVQPFGRFAHQQRLDDIENLSVMVWVSRDDMRSIVDLVRSFRRIGCFHLRVLEVEKGSYDGIVVSITEPSSEGTTQIDVLRLDASPLEVCFRDNMSPSLHACQLLYEVATVNERSLYFGSTLTHPIETLTLLRMARSSLVDLNIQISPLDVRLTGNPGWENFVHFPELPRLTVLLFCIDIAGYVQRGGLQPSLDADLRYALNICAKNLSRVWQCRTRVHLRRDPSR